MVAFTAGATLSAAALNSAFNQVNVNAQTSTSYTLALTDQGGLVTCDNTGAIALTIPPNSSVAFPVGTTILVAALNTGQVTITPGSGVTVNATPGLKVRTRYSAATLVKLGTNSWLAMGDLSA
ncbi:hypothetical protein UFOVP199_29 [uncultured Caudovirales phage]|uniref:Uncharacterized protein n=1 Tax=uncultured Caudovirales phage TaxID=2100421 RepID=A0A6J7WQA1_9CAUD|nr:hypothetical protein UFOVP199_29 [uncultured Caudovirales phage]